MAVKIESFRNGVKSFENLEEVKAWLHQERSAWSWLNGRMGGRIRDASAFDLFHQCWEGIESNIEEGNEAAVETLFKENYGDAGRLIFANSRMGRFLRSIAEFDPNVANATALFLARKPNPNVFKEEPYTLQAATIAWAALMDSPAGAEKELATIRDTGTRIVSELDVQKDSLTAQINQLEERSQELLKGIQEESGSCLKLMEEQKNLFLEGAKKEYEELKTFYQTELALKSPVDYWAAVAKGNRIWAAVWGFLFAALLSTLAYLVIHSVDEIRDFLISIQRESVAIAISVALATVAFWSLRMTAKIFLSNYHRAADASERETMAKTFLALRREEAIKDAQLDLVLAALFRPGTTGLVKDDSAPEYGLAALLSKDRQ